MHFVASEHSLKMMMDLISSSSGVCIVFGICDYLGLINEIDLERQSHSSSVLLMPRILETLNLSRPFAVENVSTYVHTAPGNLSVRALSI